MTTRFGEVSGSDPDYGDGSIPPRATRLHPTEERSLNKPWPTVLRENPPTQAERIAADQTFFATARSRSPRYPDADEALQRLQRRRETISARVLLVLCGIFAVATPFAEKPAWTALSALACLVGFGITCLVSGNRSWKRNGRHG